MRDARADVRDNGPVRVAYLVDTLACDTAGTQKQLLQTLNRLDRSRVDPTLICLSHSPWMSSERAPRDMLCLGYSGFAKPGFPHVITALVRILEERRIQVVHTFFVESVFVAWLASFFTRHRVGLVSSRRDIGLGVGEHPWYHRVYDALLPVVNRRFERIVVNSGAVRDFVASRERTDPTRIEVIRNGIDLASARPLPVPALMASRPEATWFVIAASLTPVKRHELALRAFARVVESACGGDAHLLLLGDGPLRAGLEAQAAALGIADRVHFAGAVNDVAPYLQNADVGVLCSDREGLSNAILEYMSHGLPVVATAVGGNPELVTRANGVLVPPDDAAALAAALCDVGRAASDGAMGTASRKMIAEQFGWAGTLTALERVYRSIADRQVDSLIQSGVRP